MIMRDVLEMLDDDKRKLDAQRKRNNETFPAGRELKALFDAGMPCSPGTRGHTIVRADNVQGETIGKRDSGPWADVRMDGVWA